MWLSVPAFWESQNCKIWPNATVQIFFPRWFCAFFNVEYNGPSQNFPHLILKYPKRFVLFALHTWGGNKKFSSIIFPIILRRLLKKKHILMVITVKVYFLSNFYLPYPILRKVCHRNYHFNPPELFGCPPLWNSWVD